MVPSDFELLDAWRAGDRHAGNALFDRHFDGVFRFFRNKASDGAEDLVQQTFLACVQSQAHFRKDASFRTYLFTVARSKLYDYLHHRGRHALVDPLEQSCEDLGMSPSLIIAQGQDQQHLLHALRQLPVDLQIALELYYFEQVRGPELADVLGVPEGTVRSRLRRGRDLLRERLLALAASPQAVENTMTNLESWATALREQVFAGSSGTARN